MSYARNITYSIFKLVEIAYLVTSSNLHPAPGMQESSFISDHEVGSQSNVSELSDVELKILPSFKVIIWLIGNILGLHSIP